MVILAAMRSWVLRRLRWLARTVASLALVAQDRRGRGAVFSVRPTDFAPSLRKKARTAFNKGRDAIDLSALKQALSDKNYQGVEEAMSPAIEAFGASFGPALEQTLLDIMEASGKGAAKALKNMRAAAPAIKGKPFKFDVTNQGAVDWAKEHAAETLDDLNATTVDEIRALVVDSFEQQFDVDTLSDKIADLIGDDARADVIARTESMRAANEGQSQAWDQATEAGLLTGDEKQEWIVTPDDRLCPICEPLDGEQTGLDGTFKVDGVEIDGPPAHPRCRCTIGLAP